MKCEEKCSSGCQDSCNMTSGFCVCKPGHYMRNCSLQCPEKCLNSECHQESGSCLACNNGTFGDLCNQKCYGNCNGHCDKKRAYVEAVSNISMVLTVIKHVLSIVKQVSVIGILAIVINVR